VAAGWLGAVVLAVLVGLGAISVIGARLTSPDARPKTEAEVRRDLAALPSTSSSPGPSAAASHSPTLVPVAPRVSSPTAAGPSTSPPGLSRPRGTSPPAAAPVPSVRSFRTRGGTVVATCSAAGATIDSMSPEPGFAVHERATGPQAAAEGEFRSTGDNQDRVRFAVTCPGGRPTLTDRSDGSGG
jgi:hypothetical protein